jgi:hypothetical protein
MEIDTILVRCRAGRSPSPDVRRSTRPRRFAGFERGRSAARLLALEIPRASWNRRSAVSKGRARPRLHIRSRGAFGGLGLARSGDRSSREAICTAARAALARVPRRGIAPGDRAIRTLSPVLRTHRRGSSTPKRRRTLRCGSSISRRSPRASRLCRTRRRRRSVGGQHATTPYLQRPLDFGANVVVHSATKGSPVTLTRRRRRRDERRRARRRARLPPQRRGTTLAPFEALLLLRGLKTLAVRLDRQHVPRSRSRRCSVAPGVVRVPPARPPSGRRSTTPSARRWPCRSSWNSTEGRAVARSLVSADESFGPWGRRCHPYAMSHASIPPTSRDGAGESLRAFDRAPRRPSTSARIW